MLTRSSRSGLLADQRLALRLRIGWIFFLLATVGVWYAFLDGQEPGTVAFPLALTGITLLLSRLLASGWLNVRRVSTAPS